MALAKRIILFLLVNFLVVSVISFILYFFNVQPFLNQHGLNIPSLAIFCLIWGMGGAFISLALSKMMAKWMLGVEIIDPKTPDPQMRSLIQSVHTYAKQAGLPKMPEVGIYRSAEVNGFATGPSRSNSLVAVSTGLLHRMNKEEIDGVLAHEVTHIANGDMVTMTLLQGVVNAFVMFLARLIAHFISRGSNKREESSSSSGSPFLYYITVMFLETIFMVLGTMVIARFSRYREFRADAGGARLAGPQQMISALNALKRTFERTDARSEQPAFQVLKISNRHTGFMRLFATHPPLDERIARLEQRYKIS